MVPKRGLEPLRFTSLPPQGSASTNSATWATARVETRIWASVLDFNAVVMPPKRHRVSVSRSAAHSAELMTVRPAIGLRLFAAALVRPSSECRSLCAPALLAQMT